METVRGSVWQMQTLQEITKRATLRKKNMIMQKYQYTSEIKYRHTVKIALNMWFTTVLISTFILLFPLCFISPYFSIHQDKDGRTTAGRKEGSTGFQGSCLSWNLDCIKTWDTQNRFCLKAGTGPYLSDRPRINEDAKKINTWREFWDNSHHLIIHYRTVFFKLCKPENICHSERNE